MALGLPTLLAFALALMGQSLSVQDLSGQWVQYSAPLDKRSPPICGTACGITQPGNNLVVKDSWGDTKTYDLSGKPSVISAQNGRFSSQITTTAVWESGVLVITRITKETTPGTSTSGLKTVAKLALREDNLIISGTYPKLGTGEEQKYEVTYRRKR